MKQLERVKLLIKDIGIHKLQNATVLVVGCGGVGSYCCETLARSGIGTLLIVDKDTIAMSNLNRQIQTSFTTVGQSKVQIMKKRIESYSSCNVITFDMNYTNDSNEILFEKYKIDYVVDAIDTLTSKLMLVQACQTYNIPYISSMGMANRFDPTQIRIGLLSETTYCPLARVMRKKLRQLGLSTDITCAYSLEHPLKQKEILNQDANIRKEKMPPASMMGPPAVAGISIASFVVKELIK